MLPGAQQALQLPFSALGLETALKAVHQTALRADICQKCLLKRHDLSECSLFTHGSHLDVMQTRILSWATRVFEDMCHIPHLPFAD